MLPEQLVAEIETLRQEGFSIDVKEADGFANVIFYNYCVPSGYHKTSTTLLLKFPLSYPNGRPDMFWTDKDLTLEGGTQPNKADQIEGLFGKEWRRFSWHPQNWNPGSDDLRTYLEFVNDGFGKARKVP